MIQGEHSEILSSFIKLPFAIKIFVLLIYKWPLKTGFTVNAISKFCLYIANKDLKELFVMKIA